MATQAGGLVRDQNTNVPSDVVPLGVKSSVSKAQKHGRLGGRRALNDISNSGKPSALQPSKKHNSKNVISVGEDTVPSKLMYLGGKTNLSKAPEKLQAGGRKALSDLTNSGKTHLHQASKKNQDKKLRAVIEEQALPHSVAEEHFLHNHHECIKEQEKAMDMDYFVKTIGLENDESKQLASPSVSPRSRKLKDESPQRYLEMEEVSGELLCDLSQWKKTELPSEQIPCGALKSPKPCMQLKDYNFPNFMLMETPKLSKH